MKTVSTLISTIPASPTLAVNDKAKALQAAGHDIIPLAGGDPDFDTPPHIIEAAVAAIQRGETHYPSPMKGIPPLLRAIADKMDRENGIIVDPMREIIVTPGGKWALYLALASILNAGDEVLILEPYWVSYPPLVTLAGGVPVLVGLDSERNFEITAVSIRQHLTPKTKAIMVNSPNNPTGRVLTADEMHIIADIAKEADLYVITDEIYEKLIFDGTHISLASLPNMAERTLTINGFSKAYAMTGWRLGWLAAPAQIMDLAVKLNGQTVSSAATFTMHAAVAALTGTQEIISTMRDSYQQRRDYMVTALNNINGIQCRSIEGAFYLFPSFPDSGLNSIQLAEKLLTEAGVAGTPGIAFGKSGEGHVRFAISTATADLERAIERIAKVKWVQ